MDAGQLFEHFRKFDTPTICNALEIVQGGRSATGFTRRTFMAAFPARPAIVGFARTATVRCSQPFESVARREKLLAYYEYLAQPPQPTITVIQDIDSQTGLGAFWGEVNSQIHWSLGCVGAITNGSMRDLDAMCPQFQCLAATLSPSHAFLQVVDFGQPVDVFGLEVRNGDIVHADRHGAVVIPVAAVDQLPAAIELMARREKIILDAARAPGFSAARMRQVLAASDEEQ